MKKIMKFVAVVAIVIVAGYGVCVGQKVKILSYCTIDGNEALAGCEVSSNASENKGYCSSNYGGYGDSCTTTGDSGSVRCSGNF